jgi:hypothetical protein
VRAGLARSGDRMNAAGGGRYPSATRLSSSLRPFHTGRLV